MGLYAVTLEFEGSYRTFMDYHLSLITPTHSLT